MVILSTTALEAMGYESLPVDSAIRAKFVRIEPYEIQGIVLDGDAIDPMEGSIDGIEFKVCAGTSLNVICHRLVADDFIDDEEKWKKDERWKPPFLMVVFGPTAEHVGTGRHYKREQKSIFTFDSFSAAKEELRAQSEIAMPRIITALAQHFSIDETPVRFVPKRAAVSGKTCAGDTVHDFAIQAGSVYAYVSRRVEPNVLQERLKECISLAGQMDDTSASFYHSAVFEKDPLKRFLNFFLFVERRTHATFSTIDHSHAAFKMLHHHARALSAGKQLFESHRKTWSNLRDRFIWCVLHAWTDLTDDDVNAFVRLKDVRDNISHGKISSPDSGAILEIERLANKIARTS